MQQDQWVQWDKQHCWHPFTRQQEWCADEHPPLLIDSGKGVWLHDSDGKRYIDGNASIWTNIHGHNHPQLNAAIEKQLGKIAHSSFLGFTHPLATELAARLTGFFPDTDLQRVFYSDDGSTAVECALKMALQYRMQNGDEQRTEFVAFCNAYHGDTLGAASLGGVEAFFQRFRKFGLTVHFVSSLQELLEWKHNQIEKLAGVIIEPIIQGVNHMTPWPQGMLAHLRKWTEQHSVHLILDEVMTGFGRTGTMFACQQEAVTPDFLCLAKGLTGGYLPMAATLTTEKIYRGFHGGTERAFYYGHSYTANPLGCAAALASLDIFENEQTLQLLPAKITHLSSLLDELKKNCPLVSATRQKGMIAGIDLRRSDGSVFPSSHRAGENICLLARQYGLLTRPILDTLVFLPPLCISKEEMNHAFRAFTAAIHSFTLSTCTL